MMPDLEGPCETQTDPDDALTHQMYALSPNPNAVDSTPRERDGVVGRRRSTFAGTRTHREIPSRENPECGDPLDVAG